VDINSSLNPNSEEFVPTLPSESVVVIHGDDSNVSPVVEKIITDNVDIEEVVDEQNNGDCTVDSENSLGGENDNGEEYIFDELQEMAEEPELDCQAELDIFMSKLDPAQVLVIPLKVGDITLRALVDTGASENLIKEDVVHRLNVVVEDSEVSPINGLGMRKINTKGVVLLEPQLLDRSFGVTSFRVMQAGSFKYDVILGVRFLREHGFVINIAKKKVTIMRADGSLTDVYVAGNGNISSVIHRGIPVYAAETVIVGHELKPLKVNCTVPSDEKVENEYKKLYYTGQLKDRKLEGVEGIFEHNQDDTHVVISGKNLEKGKRVKIKSGEVVGHVFTVYEMEMDEVEEIRWTMDVLKQQIKLGQQVTEKQRSLVYEMLERTQNAFGKSESQIGRAKITPYEIELTDDTPIWQRLRRFPGPVDSEVEQKCTGLMSMDILEHSVSGWSSNVVPVRKKDGELRLCVDYRKLNSVTKTDKFPMPNLSDSVYSAHNMKYFSSLDLVKGYYQIPLHPNSRPYTAFSTAHNHYQFKRVCFGLKNSGIAFQRIMQQILVDFSSKNVIIYIDDILIMTESFEEHLVLVEKVLATLTNNGIKVKISKCEFFQSEVAFLGHVIGVDGLRKSPEYIEKVANYPKPTTTTELRQFLGLVNFQCKFVENCSVIAKPLSEKTGGAKKKKVEWTEDMNRAYEILKEKLVEDVTLSFPDYGHGSERMELFVDASGIGAGGCLVQKQEGKYRTIAYASVTFNAAQTRYSTIERELTAIRWGVKAFRPFIYTLD